MSWYMHDKRFFFLGIVCIAVAFVSFAFSLVVFYVKNTDEARIVAQRLSQLRTAESQLESVKEDLLAKESTLQTTQEKVGQLNEILNALRNHKVVFEKRLFQLQTKIQARESLLYAMQQDVVTSGVDVIDSLVWITNKHAGTVLLNCGSSKGVRRGAIYKIYDDEESLGQFKVDAVLKHISFGQIINYNKIRFSSIECTLKTRFD